MNSKLVARIITGYLYLFASQLIQSHHGDRWLYFLLGSVIVYIDTNNEGKQIFCAILMPKRINACVSVFGNSAIFNWMLHQLIGLKIPG
jgi:hypothetical protein